MNWRAAISLGAALAAGAGCQTTSPRAEEARPYRGATFALDLPAGVSAAADEGDGYAVHYFRLGNSKCQMGVYEGQKPRPFASKEKDLTVMRKRRTARPDVVEGDDVWGVDSNGKFWRESVWSCVRVLQDEKRGKTFQLPTFLHIWYFGATEEEQQAFEALAAALQMLR